MIAERSGCAISLIFDLHKIGSKLFDYRKKTGLTQAEVAEAAGVCDRTYADIERGNVNMRIETVLKICKVLQITPDNIFTEVDPQNTHFTVDNLIEALNDCSEKDKKTAYHILASYVASRK